MLLNKKLENEVLIIYEKWLEAYLNGEVETYDSFLEDDYHFIGSSHVKEFSKTFFDMSRDEDTLFQKLGEQIYIISKISNWKFKNVKRAISLLAIGLIILFISGLYHAIFLLT